jgi:hypothetical protein
MSDAFTAALSVLFLLLLSRNTTARASLAGLLAGALVAVRFANLVSFLALAATMAAVSGRAFLRSSLAALASLAIALVALADRLPIFRDLFDRSLHWTNIILPRWSTATQRYYWTDGPWVIPDRLDGALFRWLCPCPPAVPQAELANLFFYPALLLGLFWIFAPPFATLPGLLYAWTQRGVPAARFTLWTVGTTLVLQLLYFYQAARFLAVPATLLVVYSSVWFAHRLQPFIFPTPRSRSSPDPLPRSTPASPAAKALERATS